MVSFVLKRLALLVPMLLGASLVIFLMLRLGPSDPAMDYLRLSRIPPTVQALAETRQRLGLDQPLAVQYWVWLNKALHLDFGVSYATGRPVLPDLLHYLPATLHLAGVALALTLGLSIPLGMWAARRRDALPDQIVRGVAFLGVSMPNFWLGFLLVLVFSVELGWLPAMGRGGAEHMIMPAVAIAFMSLSINARLLRASMLEVSGQRHVYYARLRGLSAAKVERAHILRNALLPIITATGMHVGELIGGTLVIESIFGWPGVGRFAVSAIFNRDYPVIQCFTLLMVLIFVLCNLIVDIVYAWADPRIRLAAEGAQ
ncbi:nickel ABC transporter permease subunit NikB [Rhodospirillum rubrum]|uniref:Binding-protein-dependent transport systems inner membrane component n=1 Tax=Rhodospirillum rubrum (strain ATCC 11170 / ATH 1.1.1 / DSM 467 / LMG 4362 / NCIMB 8255 / S1) TaxID=269796 RepID=Q2RS19_RHORT|nr:nickel ABC transporter permease subunit NikB [Rhodospirillum rubrum]ABC23076.1 Binding-protein-dependent transport systems inner membrane component [Rhodospirillum rubrum ATCC 11170]AEO48805.1 nickel transporter permease NikB [Rhodospirillum rubrum F11]MBK5954703.1 nickel ABC transporter permease subunit NikB [Rhodospirillum rubrum]QXG79059.1 nickel ABC transporter permease subunit NikB [Rhodospirillum rubrum]HAP99122.1 nickel ABC transporter permease subunit NikB [Rhodospirillum rubrum]